MGCCTIGVKEAMHHVPENGQINIPPTEAALSSKHSAKLVFLIGFKHDMYANLLPKSEPSKGT
jgi:hypothetical protein